MKCAAGGASGRPYCAAGASVNSLPARPLLAAPRSRPVSSSVTSLPFTAKQRSSTHTVVGYTATAETTHGMLRIDGDRLVIEWKVRRSTTRAGATYETREETDPVAEAAIPISRLASAMIQRGRWWLGGARPRLVLAANDLRAFESVTATGALSLKHPSRLEFTLARRDLDAAIDFAGELELAISDLQLRRAESGGAPAAIDSAHRRELPPGAPPAR